MNKKKVQLTTYIGIIPFYLPIMYYLCVESDFKHINLIKISLIYGALISSFLSGMQWEKLVCSNFKIAFVAIIPLVMVLLQFLEESIYLSTIIIILALLINLIIDLTLLTNLREFWFKRMRIIVTGLVTTSLIINFLSI